MKSASDLSKRQQKADVLIVFVAVVGTLASFSNIYKFAQHKQSGNAIWAAISLFAFSFLLATQLAVMRSRKR